MVENILKDAKITLLDAPLNTITLSEVEQTIESNGFVERADVDHQFNGDIKIKVWQRAATLRLMVDGYDSYITSAGYIFKAPLDAALRTHVVTGKYRPLFNAKFEGDYEEFLAAKNIEIDAEVSNIAKEKFAPLMEQRREIRRTYNVANNRYTNRRMSESEEEFAIRVKKLAERNAKQRDSCNKAMHVINGEITAIERKQAEMRREKYMLFNKRQEIANLTRLVEIIQDDPLWNEEVTQIILSEGDDKEMKVSLSVKSSKMVVKLGAIAPRKNEMNAARGMDIKSAISRSFDDQLRQVYSGDVVIALTPAEQKRRLEEVDSYCRAKLKELKRIYDEVLPRAGWNIYSEINLEYDGQAVCVRRK